jgi:hypothetical protein
VTNFCSEKKTEKKKKKNISEKSLKKKKIFWNFCPKKVFLWCLIIAPFRENKQFLIQGGGQLSGKFGYIKDI